MQKLFLPDASPAERMEALESHADKIEDTSYLKPLTQEEMDSRREILSDNFIQLADIEEEKKESDDAFKERMGPIKAHNKVLLMEIRHRQAQVAGRLYHVANHAESMMETYNAEGELIATRRLLPEEKQTRMAAMPMRKAQ